MLSGFTLVRNAIKLEYPFQESVRSVLPLCDEFVINCGDSKDGTLELCESLQRENHKIRIIHSKWERVNQEGGLQLRLQTNRALEACRGNWLLYIQADEVVHEDDYPLIKEGMQHANLNPAVDGLIFNYLHFYGDFLHTISGRNWYRSEVRLFKSGRGISAFRDAQGFRKGDLRLKAIESRARIFHYGYVRSTDSMKKKSEEMEPWWGNAPETKLERLTLPKRVGVRSFSATHPAIMKERIKKQPDWRPVSRQWDTLELKNAVTLLWERVFPFRLGEFRNFEK